MVVAFSSLARIFGEGLTINSPPALYLFIYFKEVEISSCTPVPLFFFKGQDQSTMAGRAETTVAVCQPDEVRVSSVFLMGPPYYACTA